MESPTGSPPDNDFTKTDVELVDLESLLGSDDAEEVEVIEGEFGEDPSEMVEPPTELGVQQVPADEPTSKPPAANTSGTVSAVTWKSHPRQPELDELRRMIPCGA